jgi:hypothetical protein
MISLLIVMRVPVISCPWYDVFIVLMLAKALVHILICQKTYFMILNFIWNINISKFSPLVKYCIIDPVLIRFIYFETIFALLDKTLVDGIMAFIYNISSF